MHKLIRFFSNATINDAEKWANIVSKPLQNSFKSLKFQARFNQNPKPLNSKSIPVFDSLEKLKKNGSVILLNHSNRNDDPYFRLTIPIWYRELKERGMQLEEMQHYEALSKEELLKAVNDLREEYCEMLNLALHDLCLKEGYRYNFRPFPPSKLANILSDDVSIPSSLGLVKKDVNSKELEKLVDVKELEKKFQTKFFDKHGGLEDFSLTMRKYGQEWINQKYFAPLIPVVQSFGTGKSRLMHEYGNKYSWVFHCCLRDLNSTGYPHRTSLIADMLTDPLEFVSNLGQEFKDEMSLSKFDSYSHLEVILYACYICGCLKSLRESLPGINGNKDATSECTKSALDKHRMKWNQDQYELTEDDGKTLQELIVNNTIGMLIGCMDNSDAKDEASLFSTVATQLRFEVMELRKQLNLKDRNNAPFPVLFVFDEAHTLLVPGKIDPRKLFESLLYALNLIPGGKEHDVNVMTVVLDTLASPNLTNFVPTKLRDSSLRYFKSNKLMEPYLKIQNWNLSFPQNPSDDVFKTMEARIDQLFRFGGRPLWNSICSESSKFESALGVAMLKLKGAETKGVDTESTLLALAAARFACYVFPRYSVSETLTKSHMAVCYKVDRDLDEVHVGYPVEPFIGLAAQRLMVNHKDCKIDKVIACLGKALSVGKVANGERGEILARLVLADAFDRAANDLESAVLGISLNAFFSSLFGDSHWSQLKMAIFKCNKGTGSHEKLALLEHGQVCLNQFIHCSYTPSFSDMKHWFARGAIGLSKTGQRGFDIFIPVWNKEQGYFTCILVSSIKNQKDSKVDLSSAALKSSAFFSGIVQEYDMEGEDAKGFSTYEKVPHPYIVLCLNFGGKVGNGTLQTYSLTQRIMKNCMEDAREAAKESGKSPRLASYLVKVPSSKKKAKTTVKAVFPRPENQLVIGATGFTRENVSASDFWASSGVNQDSDRVSSNHIYATPLKLLALLPQVLNVVPKSETLINDNKFSSSMLSIGLKAPSG